MSVSVKLRPYLDESLNILSQLYEIVIFTAAEQGYADAILNKYDD
jgi:TFIIF-interacting CTD phosphatase-like protein